MILYILQGNLQLLIKEYTGCANKTLASGYRLSMHCSICVKHSFLHRCSSGTCQQYTDPDSFLHRCSSGTCQQYTDPDSFLHRCPSGTCQQYTDPDSFLQGCSSGTCQQYTDPDSFLHRCSSGTCQQYTDPDTGENKGLRAASCFQYCQLPFQVRPFIPAAKTLAIWLETHTPLTIHLSKYLSVVSCYGRQSLTVSTSKPSVEGRHGWYLYNTV